MDEIADGVESRQGRTVGRWSGNGDGGRRRVRGEVDVGEKMKRKSTGFFFFSGKKVLYRSNRTDRLGYSVYSKVRLWQNVDRSVI